MLEASLSAQQLFDSHCCLMLDKCSSPGAEAAPASVALDVDRMDIRIGRVLKAELHPDADRSGHPC